MYKNYKLHKIEIDLIYYLYNIVEDFSIKFFLDSIISIEREFTGQGAFISFNYASSKKLYFKTFENKIIDGPTIISDEFLHEALTTYVFNESGLFDYIEINYGMKEKKYPKQYEFREANINTIIDLRNY